MPGIKRSVAARPKALNSFCKKDWRQNRLGRDVTPGINALDFARANRTGNKILRGRAGQRARDESGQLNSRQLADGRKSSRAVTLDGGQFGLRARANLGDFVPRQL
ncbi:hypothetical protein [Pseudomonas aeruginosa]|uniref:hypothetical protein n=1 Tax=Pseudomonas aeruginosa TaxID=287 RepID=UPI00265A9F2B|nr:hypothetical protein [Pseudomonas aeruginosa]